MLREVALEDGTLVRTLNQTQGRGQRGADWYFEKDKSLAISILKLWSEDNQPSPFHLQWVISCAVLAVLSAQGKAHWHIKWPNDIMADGKKVAGLLIEHQFKGLIQSSVIGIGVNVNNNIGASLPHAASLAQILGHEINVTNLSAQMGQQVYQACLSLKREDFQRDLDRFNQNLFLKNSPVFFKNQNDDVFEGRIVQVDADGQLLVETRHGMKAYAVGSIKLILD